MNTIRLRASDLIRAVGELPRDREYSFVNPRNRGRIVVDSIEGPEGPIVVRRYTPSRGESLATAARENISSQMLWRLANAISEGMPFNVDRVFAGSYNTRSVLEALLAHTPQFFVCVPGRIQLTESTQEIRRGHKHLVWLPSKPHALGEITSTDTDLVISESSFETRYESIAIPRAVAEGFDIEIARRHAQIQVALIGIGRAFHCRSYIARNDQGIIYGDKPLAEVDGVVTDLGSENLLRAFPEAASAGAFIDCVWFRNSRFMPAVFEVEHSTGVTSGLARMQSFRDRIPPLQTKYVIVAPDEDRSLVLQRASEPQFRDMRPAYFPYSAVEELYWITARRGVRGCNEDFIDAFLESVAAA